MTAFDSALTEHCEAAAAITTPRTSALRRKPRVAERLPATALAFTTTASMPFSLT
jgi:hypothetical protein